MSVSDDREESVDGRETGSDGEDTEQQDRERQSPATREPSARKRHFETARAQAVVSQRGSALAPWLRPQGENSTANDVDLDDETLGIETVDDLKSKLFEGLILLRITSAKACRTHNKYDTGPDGVTRVVRDASGSPVKRFASVVVECEPLDPQHSVAVETLFLRTHGLEQKAKAPEHALLSVLLKAAGVEDSDAYATPARAARALVGRVFFAWVVPSGVALKIRRIITNPNEVFERGQGSLADYLKDLGEDPGLFEGRDFTTR